MDFVEAGVFCDRGRLCRGDFYCGCFGGKWRWGMGDLALPRAAAAMPGGIGDSLVPGSFALLFLF